MATEVQASTNNPATEAPVDPVAPAVSVPVWNPKPVLVTTYSFPSMEPTGFVEYNQDKLKLPLRKDLLHRAVVFEGDRTRQGTANTKWRGEVHGSNRKLAPQKGTGRARVGDKKSPIRKGGGVAHGPHPRDFSTGLPRKIYDKAWRTALSYRYRRGELIVIDGNIDIDEESSPRLIQSMFTKNKWGSEHGRSTLITDRPSQHLFSTVSEMGKHAKILHRKDVDVKDLLETGRLIIEKWALDRILMEHSRDLSRRVAVAKY